VILVAVLLPAAARAECDPGGRCCNDAACCSDGRDNDGDGLVDCDDPSCAGLGGCPGGGGAEICDDLVDNDLDGLVDCDDSDCANDPACVQPGEVDCADHEDNDNDGFVDCDDSDCVGTPDCPVGESDCSNGIDDDADGLIDCADVVDCADDPACSEADCGNGVDDDADGLTDCADPDCAGVGCCPGPERCDDLIDNNFDGLIDCEDVDRCIDADVCFPQEICDDGIDNEGDDRIDCDDPQCVRFPGCPPPAGLPAPPVLAASVESLGCLWPPNHRMVCVSAQDVAFQASGGCGTLRLQFVACTSNQPDDGLGDGHSVNDCTVQPDAICARAERQGISRSDRIYVLDAIVVDSIGRASDPQPVGTVRVPHDARAGLRCLTPLGPAPGRGAHAPRQHR
jgi:hypothetical protein